MKLESSNETKHSNLVRADTPVPVCNGRGSSGVPTFVLFAAFVWALVLAVALWPF